LDFLRVGRWKDEGVRLEAVRYAIETISAHEALNAWIIDDTGFLKQGKESVGVQRQYTGSAGKRTNCQIGVSLCLASRGEQFPIDFELYLPQSWIDDPARCVPN
jgi:SRSO17 transposase